MVIVVGAVEVPSNRMDDAIALSVEHVRRSRSEPGCLFHAVFRDVEDANGLFFFERWADREALEAHFKVPETRAFAQSLASLSLSTPEIAIYDA